MGMNFHDIYLPSFLYRFAVSSLEFSTSISVSMSGREVRNSDSTIPKRRYFLKNCFLSKEEFMELQNFFHARAGQCFAFRMRDAIDYKVEKQIIGVGDSQTTEFQLYKTYNDPIISYIRPINKPVVSSLKLWVNEKEIAFDSLNDSGIVKFPKPIEKSMEIIASFAFDVPVRFTNDRLEYQHNKDGSIFLNNIELIEIYE